MRAENVFKSGVKCKICGAQPSIVTPIGYTYCESCVTALYGLHKSNRCTHCGKALNQEVVSKDDDVFCSIDCAVAHRIFTERSIDDMAWKTIRANSDIPDNREKKNESSDYRFDLDY